MSECRMSDSSWPARVRDPAAIEMRQVTTAVPTGGRIGLSWIRHEAETLFRYALIADRMSALPALRLALTTSLYLAGVMTIVSFVAFATAASVNGNTRGVTARQSAS